MYEGLMHYVFKKDGSDRKYHLFPPHVDGVRITTENWQFEGEDTASESESPLVDAEFSLKKARFKNGQIYVFFGGRWSKE